MVTPLTVVLFILGSSNCMLVIVLVVLAGFYLLFNA